jgi:hypothetical protein
VVTAGTGSRWIASQATWKRVKGPRRFVPVKKRKRYRPLLLVLQCDASTVPVLHFDAHAAAKSWSTRDWWRVTRTLENNVPECEFCTRMFAAGAGGQVPDRSAQESSVSGKIWAERNWNRVDSVGRDTC